MQVCDLCGKPETKTGPGSKMFQLVTAYGSDMAGDGEISIFLSPVGAIGARFSNYPNVICGRCLLKLGVDQAIGDELHRKQGVDMSPARQLTNRPQLPYNQKE